MWGHKDDLWLDGLKINQLKTCLQHKNQTDGSSVYLHIAITIHNTYFCNFYLLLSQYFNPAVLIYKVSVTKCQSAASFGIFVFKQPYICNSITQHYSSSLNNCRHSNQSQKGDGKSDTTEVHTILNKNCKNSLCLMSVKNKTNKW